jgi:hypothetical protein
LLKIGVFQGHQYYDQIFAKSSMYVLRAKNTSFFADSLGIFCKIITSVPGWLSSGVYLMIW